MIKDDFYLIDNQRVTENDGFSYGVTFNTAHPILAAHFPQKPIVPGACLLQICHELIALHLNKKIEINQVQSIKFLKLLQPAENQVVNFSFSWKTEEKMNVAISEEEVLYSKIQLTVTI